MGCGRQHPQTYPMVKSVIKDTQLLFSKTCAVNGEQLNSEVPFSLSAPQGQTMKLVGRSLMFFLNQLVNLYTERCEEAVTSANVAL